MKKSNKEVTKLAGCRIIDVVKGAVISGLHDIYLHDGKILTICGEGEPAPDADRTIDSNAGFVMPGMINTHCHIGHITPSLLADTKSVGLTKKWQDTQITYSLQQCLAYGVTTVRDALSDNLSKINALKESIQTGEISGPAMYPSVLISHEKGACIQPSSWIGKLLLKILGVPVLDYADSGTGVVTLPSEPKGADLEAAVAEAKRRGAAFIKFYDQREKMITYKPGARVLTERELHTLAASCHSKKNRTLMHHLTAEAFNAGVAAGVNTLTHLPMDRPLTDCEVEAFKKSGSMLEPTLCLAYHYCWNHPALASVHRRLAVLMEYRSSEFNALIDKYWISPLRFCVEKNFEKASAGRFRSLGGLNMLPFFRYMDQFISTGFDNLIQLLRAGCQDSICFGNDAGATQSSPAEKDVEIDLMCSCCREAGMTTPDTNIFILQMMTCNGARTLGFENRLGQIREGYDADLVVYDENPLDDAEVLKKETRLTVANGKVYSVNKGAVEEVETTASVASE